MTNKFINDVHSEAYDANTTNKEKNLQSSKNENIFHFIYITDFHGTMETPEGNQVAQILTKNINHIRKENPDKVLLAAGGDNYLGSNLCNLLYGKPAMKFFKTIGVDVSAVGEQEFTLGLSALSYTSDLLVCCNLYNKQTDKLVFPPYKMIMKSGVKFAIIGAMTRESLELLPTIQMSNYVVKDAAEAINSTAIEARNEGAQIVLAIIHEPDNFCERNGKLYDITNSLDPQKINAVLGGHSMHQFAFRSEDNMTNFNMVHFSQNGIPVAVPNRDGKSFIDFEITLTDTKVTKVTPKCYNLEYKPETITSYGSLVPFEYIDAITNPILMINDKFPWDYNAYWGFCNSSKAYVSEPIDETVYNIIAEAKNEATTLDEVIGNLEESMTLTQSDYPFGDSLAGNLTADAMRLAAKSDFSFINNSAFMKSIAPGDISAGTISSFIPYNYSLVKMKMSAAELKKMLEQVLKDEGKGIQISGFEFSYDMNKPEGSRVINIKKLGIGASKVLHKDQICVEPFNSANTNSFDSTILDVLDSSVKYIIATNDYLAAGGDGLAVLQQIPNLNTNISIKALLIDYIKANYNTKLDNSYNLAASDVNTSNSHNILDVKTIETKIHNRIINVTASNIPEGGRWVSGDFHNHSIVSDGSYTQMDVVKMSFGKFKLDWMANCDHGKRYWRDGNGQYMKSMWRWQSIRDINFPIIKELRKQYKNNYLIQGCEWNVPTHEHASVAVIENEPYAISDFEYMFNNGDNDTSREAEGLIKANRTHEDSVLAVKWLEDNYKYTSYCIINHPSKALKYDITDLRDYNNAAPTVCFGFEGMPGHQKSYQGRGEYDYHIKRPTLSDELAVKTPTYGGADYMVSKIGGVWDALLGEGRRFFTFANSDFHNLNSDFWPGEFQKNYTFVNGSSYKDIIDGMRSGKSFMVTGDLINELDFVFQDKSNITEMGGTHKLTGDMLSGNIVIRFKSPSKNNNEDDIRVDHIDLIMGEVTGKAQPGTPEYKIETNPSTKVIKTFTNRDWSTDKDGYNIITWQIENINKNIYFRLRGTNLSPNTENETDSEGNPLNDYLVGVNSASKAYKDLWFYSNPIFVEVK